MGRIFLAVFGVCLLSSVCLAAEQGQVTKQKEQLLKESYSLGYEIGANLKRQALDVDMEVFSAAVREGLEGRKPAFTAEELRDALASLRRKAMVAQDIRRRELEAKTLEEGKAFLEANGKKEGVRTLPDGLQYTVLTEGSGPTPKATDIVKVDYRGTLVDGTEFDNSYKRSQPAIIRADGMIRGWTEALQLMKVGSRWKIFVPAELAYGKRQFGRIPANSVLIFDMELLAVGNDLIPGKPELKPANEKKLPGPASDEAADNEAGGAE